jgi:hypothetical protein
MDQLHRPFIHNTYHENIRIALGRHFSVSLTKWNPWPFFITVTDMRLAEGLYYQSFTLAGIVFVHNIITMHEQENDVVRLRLEWLICSHRLLKPLHYFLGRSFLKLNARLQTEDAQVRGRRFELRKKGYTFRSDPPDYFTANLASNNTIYPALPEGASLRIEGLSAAITERQIEDFPFLLCRDGDHVLIWPATCPHEGGPLGRGILGNNCRIECPWHGMKFAPARVGPDRPTDEAYGFSYSWAEDGIRVRYPQRADDPSG